MSSPFASQLGTNYIPTDKELAEIQALLVEPTNRLECLDHEIAAMQDALDKLSVERHALEAYLSAHKALISPVRRLPLDIIQEIFVACMPTHRNCVMSAKEAPVVLGRICSPWRQISLGTPRLWARLHIVEPSRPFSFDDSVDATFEAIWVQRLETAKMWLGRSGDCPLSISLEGSIAPVDPAADAPPRMHTGRFLEMLAAFASRWQHISFKIGPSAWEILASLAETDVPILETIKLFQNQNFLDVRPIDLAQFGMLTGGRIRSFSVSGVKFRLTDLPLRWDQLTTLAMCGSSHSPGGADPSVESAAALRTISRCPALRNCTLRLADDFANEPPAQHSIVEHALIETLELTCVGTTAVGDTVQNFFSHLSLPRLKTFTLRTFWHVQPPNATSSLCRFLASATHLATFDVNAAPFPTSSLVEIMRILPPSVLHVHLGDPLGQTFEGPTEPFGLNDDVLDAFNPRLRLHTLEIQHIAAISDAGLLRFIATRMAAPTSAVVRIHVKFARTRERNILPDLETAIEAGLQVSLTYLTPAMWISSLWQGLPDDPRAVVWQ